MNPLLSLSVGRLPMLYPYLPPGPDEDYNLHTLPYGVFSHGDNGEKRRHIGVAIGAWIFDLTLAEQMGLLLEVLTPGRAVFGTGRLNDFIALGPEVWASLRTLLQKGLASPEAFLAGAEEQLMTPRAEATMHLPLDIGDYTDFYSSEYHATNVGRLFRPDNPILPNWHHMPIGYHGRASSIVVTGTPVHRPCGQRRPPDAEGPLFGPSVQLDFELETGLVIGVGNPLGHSIPLSRAEGHIFGMVLFNDWSARDHQAWEYQPLGPFLGKNFASTISAWVTPMAALEACRTAAPAQDEPRPLPYLEQTDRSRAALDIELTVELTPAPADALAIDPDTDSAPLTITRTNQRYLYWTPAQQVAHHTVGGCNLRVGDILASGTISGPEAGSLGCLLEITRRGAEPITLPGGGTRTFLVDGDRITLRGYGRRADGGRVTLGECTGQIVAAPGNTPVAGEAMAQ